MKKKRNDHVIDSIFVIMLFCIFAVTVLMCAMAGSSIYKSIAQTADERYNEHTALAYIETKLRHYDSNGSIHLTDYDGINAIAMDEFVDGHNYNTVIYCYDGYIREIFFEKGGDFGAEDGIKIIPAKSLDFSLENEGLMRITTEAENGTVSEIYYSIKST